MWRLVRIIDLKDGAALKPTRRADKGAGQRVGSSQALVGLLQFYAIIGQLSLVVHIVDVERGMALEQVVRYLAPVLLEDGRGGLGEGLEMLSLIHV